MARRLVVVAGTRPELVKTYSVIRWLEMLGVDYEFVWTGQHYDYEMSRVFFEELRLPEPDAYLDAPRSASLPEKLSYMVSRLSRLGLGADTVVYALGDTASTLAAAIAAEYSGAVFIHDEAGVRSFDLGMLEEANRRLADQVAWLHLTPSAVALVNLVAEGVACDTILLTGSTLVDAFRDVYPAASRRANDVLSEMGIEEDYALVTLHRRENLRADRLRGFMDIVDDIVNRYGLWVVFPIHPHTRKVMIRLGLLEKLEELRHVRLLKPLGYIEFLALLSRSRVVLTDSGGVQQEAFLAGRPTLTLRPTTEWIETVLAGYNYVTDLSRELARRALEEALGSRLRPPPPVYGDGRSGWRVAKTLSKLVEGDSFYERLVEARERLTQGPLVPILRGTGSSASGGFEASELCFSNDGGVASACDTRVASRRDGIDRCVALRQFRLTRENDVEFLRRVLLEDMHVDWAGIDKVISSL